jgi:DnaJ-class molecular chaperone
MERPKDYYGVLGVARDASPAAIKRAYRRLSRAAESEEAIQAVRDAFETLSNAELRRRYDERLKRNERAFEQLTSSVVRGSAEGVLRRPIRPGSVSGEIVLGPVEARRGGVLPIELPVERCCPACQGTGGSGFGCFTCGGEGTVTTRLPLSLRLPPGVRDGAVFQVRLDQPTPVSAVITVHVRSEA